MEKYLVSARKYRPATFANVVGQKALTVTLKNAIATERLAHAYLFCGSRGVGKTSCARIFAKTINCSNRTADGEACNECESCRQFNENRSLNIIELDAASNNGVEDIRQLTDQVQIPPTLGNYRVFIIDEVHMLSSQAFNAFLKTLEEPPEYVIFILATTEKQKIIPTILSRCQIYDFNRITIADMVEHLQYVAQQEGIETEPAALNVIARKADGAMRDALSIFDQVAASGMGRVTYQATIESLNVLDSAYFNRLMEAFLSGNVTDALLTYKEIRDHGFNNHFFLNGLADYFRDLVVARDPRTIELLESDDEHRKEMAAIAAKASPAMLYRAMELCNTADLNYRTAANKQFLVELTLIKLCQADSPSPIDDGGEGQKLRPIAVRKTSSDNSNSSKPAQPVVKPTPAPAPIPAPAPAPAPAVKPAKINIGPSISIKAGVPAPAAPAAPTATAAQTPTPVAQRTEPFSDQEMRSAWLDYAVSHPTEQALIASMRSCLPRRSSPSDFTLVIDVESQAQRDTFEAHLPQIMAHMAARLKNDTIRYELKNIEGEGSPATWTERRVLEHTLESNRELAVMMERLKLSLE